MAKLMKKRWVFLLGIVIFIGGGFYFKQDSDTKAKQAKNTYTVKRETIKDELSLSGEIAAEEHVTLRFQSSGKLAWVGVKEGDYVKKYQSIASLDQREVQQNLKKYLNTFLDTRTDFDQEVEDTQLNNIGGLTDAARRSALRVLDQAQYDLNDAVIDVELKKLAIEYSSLSSPIDGIVVRVGSPYAGVNITPAQAEFEIINPNTVYFSATADETDVVRLSPDMPGEVILDSYENQIIKARISLISFVPKSGETGTVYSVKIVFDKNNGSYQFSYGMSGDANFVSKIRNNIITVPSGYIQTEKGKKYVWKLKNDKKLKTFVKVGEEIDGSVEIKSGLHENDVIQSISL